MRHNLLAGASIALTGAALTIGAAWVHLIPSWQLFHLIAPACFSIASIAAIVRVLWRKGVSAPRSWRRSPLRIGFALLLVIIVLASLCVSLVIAALAPRVERTYTFEGSQPPVYLVENACFPPDSKAECDEYWTEIRLPIGPLPLTRTIHRCRCFYEEPEVTPSTITFPVEHTYALGTSPTIIDRETMRVLVDHT